MIPSIFFNVTSLWQCIILLPKQKTNQHPLVFADFLDQLNDLFGGYTNAGTVDGSWKERLTGSVHPDHSLVILVAVPPNPQAVHQLKACVAVLAYKLGEKAIYMLVEGRETSFVWAAWPSAA